MNGRGRKERKGMEGIKKEGTEKNTFKGSGIRRGGEREGKGGNRNRTERQEKKKQRRRRETENKNMQIKRKGGEGEQREERWMGEKWRKTVQK